MSSNHSKYTLAHSEHRFLSLLPRFYPAKLKVEVISGGELGTCFLEELPQKEFPLVLDLTCSRAYTFYHCLAESPPNHIFPEWRWDDGEVKLREQIQLFLRTRETRAHQLETLPAIPSDLIRGLLTSIPEIHRLGALGDRFYIGYGNTRAYIAELTPERTLRDSTVPGFDLDDGFFEPETGEVLPELQRAYKAWRSRDYVGPILF